jgi:hypothetical protein
VEENDINNSINKRGQPLVKKPVYDILGYNTNLAVKMTAFANPNHMVIGQLVYDALGDNQKSTFRKLVVVQKYGIMLTTILEVIDTKFIQTSEVTI